MYHFPQFTNDFNFLLNGCQNCYVKTPDLQNKKKKKTLKFVLMVALVNRCF